MMSNDEQRITSVGLPNVEIYHLNSSTDNLCVRVSIKGYILTCTSEEVENARLRQMRSMHRRRLRGEEIGNMEECVLLKLPYIERYIVLDATCEIPRGSSCDGGDNSADCQKNNDKLTCKEAMMHSYGSFDEYQRKCNSARKKHRLRVDRLADSNFATSPTIDSCMQKDNENGLEVSTSDGETEFRADSLDGTKILGTWYFRSPTMDAKQKWTEIVKIN